MSCVFMQIPRNLVLDKKSVTCEVLHGKLNFSSLFLSVTLFFFFFFGKIYFTWNVFSQSLFLFYLFIYLFMAALGLRCCTQAFSNCSEWGLLFIAVRGLLIAVASLVAEHRL